MACVQIPVRVRPGASRTSVGGRYGDAEPAQLVVRVSAPAVDGKATQAVLHALAAAFGVPKRDVALVSGASARSKVIRIESADEESLKARLEVLLNL